MLAVLARDPRAEGVQLHCGRNYWYFSGGIADRFEVQSVMVPRIRDLTVGGWHDEFAAKADAVVGKSEWKSRPSA